MIVPEVEHDHPSNPELLTSRYGPFAVAALCLVAFAVMGSIALSQWLAGRWYLADVGNIQQVMINTWYGRFMYSPLNEANFFGAHFTPILFLLMPLVWLSEYPVPLVTTYVLALALTPWPIYALARQRGLSPLPSLALGFWFLCNHFTGSLQLANHFESLYVLAALSAMALIRHYRSWPFYIAAALALSVKEDCLVWLAAYGAWEWLYHRQEPLVKDRARNLIAMCLLWAALAGSFMFLNARGESSNATRYLDRMGGISVNFDTLKTLLLLVATSGGLCLLNWRAALLLLVPLPVILGNFPFTRHLLYYYSYPFLPFLALATVTGASTLSRKVARQPAFTRSFGVAVASFLAILGGIQYILPTRTDEYKRIPLSVTPRDDMRRQVASDELPRGKPLALQFNLWGITPREADVSFLNEKQLRPDQYVFMDLQGPHGLTPEEHVRVMTRLRDEVAAGRRTQIFDRYDFVILSPDNDDSTTGSTTQ